MSAKTFFMNRECVSRSQRGCARIDSVSTVVVSTHLDDAVLSCYRELGPETIVVTVLRRHPAAGRARRVGSRDRRHRLARPDARAAGRGHRARSRSPAAVPSTSTCSTRSTPSCRPRPRSRQALAPILEPADRVLGPAGILNVDHKVVRDAVLLARPDAVLYADLPYALHPDRGGFALPEEIADRGAERLELRLADAELAEKLAAVRCYPTPARPARRRDFGDFLGPGLGREVLWRLQAATGES